MNRPLEKFRNFTNQFSILGFILNDHVNETKAALWVVWQIMYKGIKETIVIWHILVLQFRPDFHNNAAHWLLSMRVPPNIHPYPCPLTTANLFCRIPHPALTCKTNIYNMKKISNLTLRTTTRGRWGRKLWQRGIRLKAAVTGKRIMTSSYSGFCGYKEAEQFSLHILDMLLAKGVYCTGYLCLGERICLYFVMIIVLGGVARRKRQYKHWDAETRE